MPSLNEQIENFKGFIEQYYEKKLHELASKGISSVYIDFFEVAEFSPELAEFILDTPEDAVKTLEMAISEFDVNIRARIFNIPKSQFINIKDIRSKHLGKFIYIEGIVRQASDVRPQVTSAKFECPTCGNTLSILQLDTKFREPNRCSCGNKNRFRLLSKELVDAQRLVIEESPENLEGGEQSKRLPVYLKEDLVEPKMEKKTTPGSKVRINRIIKEVSIVLKTGAKSVNFELMMDANSIIPIEETYEEIEISKEIEQQIKDLAKDEMVYEKLTKSIDDYLDKKSVAVKAKNVAARITKDLDDIPGDVLAEAQGKSEAKKILKEIIKIKDSKGLFSVKKWLNGRLGKVYTKLEKGNPLSPAEEVILSARDSVDDLITKVNPEIKNLTIAQSHLRDAAPSLARARQVTPTMRIAGTTMPAGVSQKVTNIAGQGLQKVGEGISQAGKTAETVSGAIGGPLTFAQQTAGKATPFLVSQTGGTMPENVFQQEQKIQQKNPPKKQKYYKQK